jgi:dTDP-4-dehydrorhamnose 3,5-epimerase-like enzyme
MGSMPTLPGCKRISLPEVGDQRGRLIVAEETRHIPFGVKRIFAIYDVPADQTRGGHAHRAQHQLIIMMVGACVIFVDDGSTNVEEHLNSRSEGLYVPPGVWIELKDFAPGSVCLVLASGLFEEADYIHDYGEFKKLARVG